jgi:ubiquinone/menaquinone biosynthesis C-methylase UbiE
LDRFFKANKDIWEKWTEIHKSSEFYDIEKFLEGKNTLDPIEVKELGNVEGKSLLHLMCHFGQDTLSWARLGAKVTGIDFSEKAISLARSLADKMEIDAEFICTNIYDLPDFLDNEFDILFTSGGVLTWLPDLERWAEIIFRYLKPGGTFYIREFHPFFYIFDDSEGIEELKVKYSYFQDRNKPEEVEVKGSYADTDADVTGFTYEWNYPISLVINSLIKVGLQILFFNEYPYVGYPYLPFLIKNDKGYWVLPMINDRKIKIPMMFSLKAIKNE